jgi:hypothetical protein
MDRTLTKLRFEVQKTNEFNSYCAPICLMWYSIVAFNYILRDGARAGDRPGDCHLAYEAAPEFPRLSGL